MDIARADLLAWRVRAQHLADRLSAGSLTDVAGLGLQDTPAGSAAAGFAARVEGVGAAGLAAAVGPGGELVTAWTVRGAPHVIRARELGLWAAALRPFGPASAIDRLYAFGQRLAAEGVDALEAIDETAVAMRDALAGGPLSRSDLSTAVTARLRPALRPWCDGCGVEHVEENLFRYAALPAGAVLAGDARPTTLVLAGEPDPVDPADARREIARRVVHALGVATAAEVAQWLGALHVDDGAALLAAAGDAATPDLSDVEPVRGLRLVPPNDLLLRLGDRAALVGDRARRSTLYRALNGPGALLVDGVVSGTWRARRQGRRLALTVTPWQALDDTPREVLEDEATLMAAARGQTSATVMVEQAFG